MEGTELHREKNISRNPDSYRDAKNAEKIRHPLGFGAKRIFNIKNFHFKSFVVRFVITEIKKEIL